MKTVTNNARFRNPKSPLLVCRLFLDNIHVMVTFEPGPVLAEREANRSR